MTYRATSPGGGYNAPDKIYVIKIYAHSDEIIITGGVNMKDSGRGI